MLHQGFHGRQEPRSLALLGMTILCEAESLTRTPFLFNAVLLILSPAFLAEAPFSPCPLQTVAEVAFLLSY
jgi:hypothetical protein